MIYFIFIYKMTITPANPITIRIHNNAYARFHQIFCRFARKPMFQYRYEENTLATFWTDRDTEQIYIHPDDFRDFHLATDINQPDYGEVMTIVQYPD